MKSSTIEKVREKVEITLMKGLTMVPKRLRKLDIFNETYNTNVLSFQILMRKESCISTTTIGRIALCHIVWVGVWENEMGLKQK